jgi:hypothetical protein
MMQQLGVKHSCRQATDVRLLALTLQLRESVDDDGPGPSSARGGKIEMRAYPVVVTDSGGCRFSNSSWST